jgi:hypothetical protein
MSRSVLIGFLLIGLARPASAQVSPEHIPAALDTLLAAKNYKKLGQTIWAVSRRDDLNSDLDWLQAKMMTGETAFITMLYSKLLWTASTALPAAPQHQLKESAAMATLYAYSAIRIDGTRCGDRTAPTNRLQQLGGWNPEIWPFLASLSDDERNMILKLVPLLEKRTAARRDQQGDIEFLCRSGMEETSYNLAHGSAREIPPAPGQIGRQIQLSGDGKYRPSERPEAEWKAEALKRRETLPQALAEQVASLSAPKPATQ